MTDSAGIATAPTFTANGIAGAFTITAGVSGVGGAIFSLTDLAGTSASVTASSGTPQSDSVSTPFAATLQATVRDASNNPVSGALVTFTIPPGAGASATFPGNQMSTAASTNAGGIATALVLTANGTAGSYAISAAVVGVFPSFAGRRSSGATGVSTGGGKNH
jgi:hypothetical protein